VISSVFAGPLSPAASRLVAATIDALQNTDGFNIDASPSSIARLLDEAETNYEVLFDEFGGVEGLLDTARLARLESRSRISIDLIETSLSSAQNHEQAIGVIRDVARVLSNPEFTTVRLARTAVIGSTLTRPELREAVGVMQNELTNRLSAVIEAGEQRGLYRCSTSPRTIAAFLQASSAGQILNELDPQRTDPDEWINAVDAAARGLFLPPLGLADHVDDTPPGGGMQ